MFEVCCNVIVHVTLDVKTYKIFAIITFTPRLETASNSSLTRVTEIAVISKNES